MRTARMFATLAVAGCLVAGVTGCGGGSGDVGSAKGEDGVRDVLGVLATAVPDGDGPRVCSLLAPEAQERLASATATSDCVAAVKAAAGRATAADLAGLGDAEIEMGDGEEKAAVTGEAAQALAEVMGASDLSLLRLEEHWVIG